MGRKRIEKSFRLPRNEYMEATWFIRGYRRALDDYEAILESSSAPSDGQPRGSGTSDPTFLKASRLAAVSAKIRPVEIALERVPSEYRRGLLRAIIERERYPDYAHPTTWARWRHRFVYWVAVEAGIHFDEAPENSQK